MHYSSIFLIGLVSLVSTITANPATANGKHALAKRLYTTTSGHCTAVCGDPTMQQYCYDCSPSTNVQAAIAAGPSTTVVDGSCTAICNTNPRYTSSLDCVVHCGPTPTPTPTPVLQKRFKVGSVTATATYQDCTAVCSGGAPSIHCDEPSCGPWISDQTPAPTPKPLLERRTLTLTDLPDPSVVTSFADGCEEICFEDEEEFVCILDGPRTGTAT